MVVKTSKNSPPPDWYAAGLGHVWLPYAQMKSPAPPGHPWKKRSSANCVPACSCRSMT
ncbi:MAG: hypothetical protein P8Y53_02480 [Pseudolabrys sp.]